MPRRTSLPLQLEHLEDRVTPSVTVTTTLDPTTPIAGQLSLREAIAEVNAGQEADNTILLPSGVYQNAQGALNVTHSLILQGAGAANTILDGGGMDRVVLIDPTTTVSVQISGVTVCGGNSGGDGGGIDVQDNAGSSSVLTVQNCILSDNVAAGAGGGIQYAGGGNLTLTDDTIDNNQARGGSGGGGVAYTGAGTVNVANSIFHGNIGNNLLAGGFGGGGGLEVDNAAAVGTVTDSLFEDNDAAPGGGGGLDVSHGLTLTVIGSTFLGNHSEGNFGGGLKLQTTGTDAAGTASRLVDDTFVGNRSNVGGGAVSDFAAGDVHFTSDTITGNSAFGGGGVGVSGGTAFFLDTIIAGNLALGNAPGTDILLGNFAHITSQGGNFIGDGTAGPVVLFPAGNPNADGDIVGTLTNPLNPLLAPPQNNGGILAGAPGDQQIVPTERLLPGSPAFGKGVVNGAPFTDERGFPRLTPPDIGAVQFENAALTVSINPASPTVNLNGTETIAFQVANVSGNTLPADNSTLTVTLPAGLAAPAGTPLTFPLGTLAAGQSETFTLTVTATQLGPQVVSAVVTSIDTTPATTTTSATVTVVQPPPVTNPITNPPTTIGGNPNPVMTHTPIGALSLFGFGFGPGLQLDLFEVDSKGELFAVPFGGANGTPIFLSPDVVFANLRLMSGAIVSDLTIAADQMLFTEILNFTNPFVFQALLKAISSHA
jgi:hypothetical protein